MTDRLGPFRVLRMLGRGGMGVVYQVQDPDLDRPLALKLILERGASDEALERFWREADALAKVRHRSIVRIHQVGELPEGPYILQELVTGETLERIAERGPLEPDRAAWIVVQLADALEAVHRAGILHRDVKPSNVMLGANDIPVLLDFGLARDATAETLTKSNVLLGSPATMAPEQTLGRRDLVDERTDVYGLGVLLYCLLVGGLPFEGESALEVLRQITHLEPAWPRQRNPAVPTSYDAICRRAMAKEPNERFASAKELGDTLQRALDGEPVGPGRACAWVIGGAVALCAVGLLGVAWFAARPRERPSEAPPAPAAPDGTAVTPTDAAPDDAPRAPAPPPIPPPPGVSWRDGEYVNDADGSVLVYVPPGSFDMGTTETLKDFNDTPVHRVRLRGYFIAKCELTWERYLRFCEATHHDLPISTPTPFPPELLQHPVMLVTWHDAQAYCAWAKLRLPTEAEWEYAARGDTHRRFPWGDDLPTPEHCNSGAYQDAAGNSFTTPVGQFPLGVSFAGCQDMAGNVWEWVADGYDPFYHLLPEEDPVAKQGAERVVRGGSWRRPLEDAGKWFLCAYREHFAPDRHQDTLGFRVARDLR